jgi:WD40 repeat protein
VTYSFSPVALAMYICSGTHAPVCVNMRAEVKVIVRFIVVVRVYSYPGLKPLHVLDAHPSNCISLKFDQSGRYFAIGSADAPHSIWDVGELTCVATVSRLVL